MIRRRFHQNWMFECPDAVLTCAILKCDNTPYFVFGGHDKTLYLMDQELTMLDDVQFDGWVRSMFPVDLDGDGCDELLVGSGDGTCCVLKFDKINKKFFAIMRYKPPRKVKIPEKINCCAAGDIFRNGTWGLIFGGEDKSLKIFKDVSATKPLDALHYDSWVNACALDFLTVPPAKRPIYGILVATKSGWLQFIQIIEDTPDILWQQYLNSSINTVRIVDANNDGYNEIVVGCDDNYIKILNGQGQRLRYINTEGCRPLTVFVDDIDGDNAKEIVVGCADGSLKIYHNQTPISLNFELKWKTKLSTSIEDICTLEDSDKLRHIIFGGYDRTLRNYLDFEWGKKKKVDVARILDFTEVPPKDRVKATEKPKFEAIPTNIRGHIVKNFEEKGFYVSKDALIKDLLGLSYTLKDIQEELERMDSEKLLLQTKLDTPVWKLSTEAAKIKPEVAVKVITTAPEEEPFTATVTIKTAAEVKAGTSTPVTKKVELAPKSAPQVKAAPVPPKAQPAPKAAPQAKVAPATPKAQPAPKAAPQVKAAPIESKIESAPKAAPQPEEAPVAPKVEVEPKLIVEAIPAPKPEVTPVDKKITASEPQTKIEKPVEEGIKPNLEPKVEAPKEKAVPKVKAALGKKAPKAKPTLKPEAASDIKKTAELETQPKVEKPIKEGEKLGSKPPLKDIIIEYLKGAKLVPSKANFVADIEEKGYSKEEIEIQINTLHEEGLITHSKVKPIGWSLTEKSA